MDVPFTQTFKGLVLAGVVTGVLVWAITSGLGVITSTLSQRPKQSTNSVPVNSPATTAQPAASTPEQPQPQPESGQDGPVRLIYGRVGLIVAVEFGIYLFIPWLFRNVGMGIGICIGAIYLFLGVAISGWACMAMNVRSELFDTIAWLGLWALIMLAGFLRVSKCDKEDNPGAYSMGA